MLYAADLITKNIAMNKEEKLIRSYFESIEDINQSQSIEVLPLTLVDMLLEYGEILSGNTVKLVNECEHDCKHISKPANCAIQSVIASADFRKELQDAIESCKYTDYCWDGEDEAAFDAFDAGDALSQVIEVLEKHLL